MQRIRQQLLKFVAHRLPANQPITIYGFMPNLTLLQPRTADRALLAKRISAITGWLLRGRTVAASSVFGSGRLANAGGGFIPDTAAMTRPAYDYDPMGNEAMVRARAIQTLLALRSLARTFQDVPGHKTVVWVTDDLSALGFSMGRGYAPNSLMLRNDRFKKVIERLNDASVSLYPLQLQGLTPPPVGDVTLTYAQFKAGQTIAANSARMASLGMSQTLGSETGGAALIDNNFGGEVLKAMRDWSSYYVVSFAPPQTGRGYEPKAHKIKVKVDVRGARALFRREYIQRPEKYLANDKTISRDLKWALHTPVALSSLPLAVQFAPACSVQMRSSGLVRGTAILPFALTIAPQSVLHTTAKGVQMDIAVQLLLENANPKQPDEINKMVRMARTLTPAQASAVEKNGMKYYAHFEAQPGQEYFAAVALRDNRTGQIGTVRRYVHLEQMPAPCPQKR